MIDELQTLKFDGIRSDSLGNYLTGLGLLSALSTSPDWRGLRGCWRDGCFVITAREITREQVESYLLDNWNPTPYSRWWAEKQKADTKAKSDQNIWRARSAEAISNVRLLDAHIAGVGRNQFNPVLYTGGKIGQRDLSKAFEDASDFIAKTDRARIIGWLNATLYAELDAPLPELTKAGTWFVYANKTFNSGQAWSREGQISPWSLLLAIEGALLLIGGVARRLRANARSYAVFPFVTDIPSPQSENEVGLTRSEFWAPLWKHPTSLPEVRALLERGLARIGQRAAKAPHEFAIAARSAGVDAGVSAFVRFALRKTTAKDYYEAIPRERIEVGSAQSIESQLIEPIIPWIERLRTVEQTRKSKGIAGPVEEAIIRLAERPDNDPERWQRLLLLLAQTQSRIDRNKDLRERCQALNRLDAKWFGRVWPSPPVEVQIARAIASITTPETWRANSSNQSGPSANSIGARSEMPLLVNIFGVELSSNATPLFSGEGRPHRAIWHNGEIVRLLADVIERRLIDTDAASSLPLAARCFCSTAAISAFLSGAVDAEMIGRWIPALSLIRWTEEQASVEQGRSDEFNDAPDGTFLLQALFRPLFYPHQLRIRGQELFPERMRLRPRAATARRLLNLIRQGELSEAVQLVQNRYLAARHSIVLPPSNLNANYERIVASLLIPMKPSDAAAGLRRWLQPSKNQTER